MKNKAIATIIAVLGSKESGKTTTIEALTRELTRRGYKVAAVKHIPEEDFTIDTKGKDTWRFAEAGAKTIVSISPKETAIIEKGEISNLTVEGIVEKCQNSDIILIEGFRKLLGENPDVPKIVAVKSREDVAEALKTFKPIIAFTGPYPVMGKDLPAPYFDVFRESAELTELVEKIIREKRGF
ncbi:MAG: molybdopterin-guanine dinucleotide biosynthesis protein B [Candidatus Bathyarchaeia archaeon]